MQTEEIAEKVKKVISEAMGINLEDINLNSRLVADLGAESIDFLDITFRLEREFGVKLKTDEMFPTGIFQGKEGGYIVNGRVIPEGVAKLKEAIPFGNFQTWEKNPEYATITDIFTVGSIVNYIGMQQKVIS